jgi:hypothetical protein
VQVSKDDYRSAETVETAVQDSIPDTLTP